MSEPGFTADEMRLSQELLDDMKALAIGKFDKLGVRYLSPRQTLVVVTAALNVAARFAKAAKSPRLLTMELFEHVLNLVDADDSSTRPS